jgi:hypothetical protein
LDCKWLKYFFFCLSFRDNIGTSKDIVV